MNRFKLLTLVAFTLPFGLGCAGARTNIVAPDSRYPVSLSEGVRDADGTLVPQERKIKVANFGTDRKAWGMLYSGAKLTPNTDISQAVNAQVHAVKGDAIVNLRLAAVPCSGVLWPLLNLVPFYPACSEVRVKGDIVAVIPKSPEAAPRKKSGQAGGASRHHARPRP